MSRIGRQPIAIPSGVEVTIAGSEVSVKGPKGQLMARVDRDMKVAQNGDTVTVTRPTDEQRHRALHGLTRSIVANMVLGVSTGFTKTLEIEGVGYRAQLKGKDLELALGYSHAVVYLAPEGIDFEVPAPNRIIVSGIDKQCVGQVAAEIRAKRPPEPYKGKGIRYTGEYVRRKVGKTAK